MEFIDRTTKRILEKANLNITILDKSIRLIVLEQILEEAIDSPDRVDEAINIVLNESNNEVENSKTTKNSTIILI